MSVSCDVLVVGAGLAGAWAAKELCEAGLSVTLVEAGPDLTWQSSTPCNPISDEDRRNAALRQSTQSQHPAYWTHNPEHFVDDVSHPYGSPGPEPFVWIRGRQVGGRSLTWGGVTLRLSDYELRTRSSDDFGLEWPIALKDLAPWYAVVEHFLGVGGCCDNVVSLPDGVFTRPPPLSLDEQAFKHHVEATWSDRRVVTCRGIVADDPTSSSHCGWSPLAVQHRVLPAAVKTGRLNLRPDTIVAHLISSRSANRVLGVSCVDRRTSERFELRAAVTVLCASTIESVRILLNSHTPSAPDGLGNSSGCLGRFVLDHMATIAVGRIPGSKLHDPMLTRGAHGVLIPRFRNCDRPHPQFIRGYGIWGSIGRVGWPGTDERMWSLCAMLEVLGREQNRITIEKGQKDAWGVPSVRIDFRYSHNEWHMREDAQSVMREIATSCGWRIEQVVNMRPGQFVHELGGARMGDSPASSVLNAYNQSWDVQNLFVLDGACFPTSGWQNPTLTIMALAVRACHFIAAGFRRGEFQ